MNLARNYKAARAAGMTAAAAIAAARKDVAENRTRYTPSHGAGLGATFAAYGCAGLRWVENPKALGLRKVGFADELARIGHTGWYSREDCDGSLIRGVVYRLAGRGRCALYVAGWADPENDGAACLDFADVRRGEADGDDQSVQREMAREADGIAERCAEAAREHDNAWQSGRRWAELGAEAVDLRTEYRKIRAELREVREVCITGVSALCETITARLHRIVVELGNLKSERATLVDLWSGRHVATPLVQSFNDGAESPVIQAGVLS